MCRMFDQITLYDCFADLDKTAKLGSSFSAERICCLSWYYVRVTETELLRKKEAVWQDFCGLNGITDQTISGENDQQINQRWNRHETMFPALWDSNH